MKWASAISEATPLDGAIQECVTQIKQQLGDISLRWTPKFGQVAKRESRS